MSATGEKRVEVDDLDPALSEMIRRLSVEHAVLLIDDERRSVVDTEECTQTPISIPVDLSNALRELALGCDVDVETALLAAYALTLGRYAGLDKFVIGCTRGSASKDSNAAPGCVQGTAPLFVRIAGDQTFPQFIECVRLELQSAMQDALPPLEALIARNPQSAASMPTCYFAGARPLSSDETRSMGERTSNISKPSRAAMLLRIVCTTDSIQCMLEHSVQLQRLAIEFVDCFLGLTAQGVADSSECLATFKGHTSVASDMDAASRDPERPIPLSAAQRAMWIHLKTHPEKERYYNVGNYVELQGPVDVSLFARAVRHAVNEIAALRIRILETRSNTMQSIRAPGDFELPIVDCSKHADPVAKAWEWMRSDEARQFGLDNARPFTMALLKVSGKRFFWYCHYSHMVIDGYGMQIVKERVCAAYSALCRNEEPRTVSDVSAYCQYLCDEREYRLSWTYMLDKKYWSRFPVENDAVTLSVRGGVAPMVADPLQSAVIELPTVLSSALKRQAKDADITLSKYLIALIALFLHKASGRPDLTIGLPVHGRFDAKTRGVSAPCVNVLPVRFSLNGEMDIGRLSAHVDAQLKEALRHGRYRLEEIRRVLGYKPGQFGIFNVVVNVLPVPGTLDFGSVKGYTTTAGAITPGYVDDIILWVFLNPESAQIVIKFEANPGRYEAWEVDQLAKLFAEMLGNISSHSTRLRDISILGTDSRALVSEWSQGDRLVVADLLSELRSRSTSAPDSLAAIMEDRVLTYREWDERSSLLGSYLSERFGVGAMFAVFMERSIESLVALIAVMKSGGVYVPLDTADPIGRIEALLQDAKVAAIITETRLCARLPASTSTVCMDTFSFGTALHDIAAGGAGLPVRPEATAYCIFTSGSTGRPKGVCIKHSSLANHAFAMQMHFKLTTSDRVLHFASLAFDASLEEIFPTLLAGAALVVQSQRLLPTDRLLELIARESVSVLNLPLSYWERLTDDLILQRIALPSSVRLVVVGGERLTTAAVRRWHTVAHSRSIEFLNTYGPTEGTISATVHRVEQVTDSDSVPIGKPISNVNAYILDETFTPMPPGIPGDLFLGGACVAQGYLNRDELTADRFKSNPFADGPEDRVYKTGDRARFLKDGTLEFLGRSDGQVKLRGFRIELGEIESVLLRHPAIRQCAVVLDSKHDRRKLTAFFVAVNSVSTNTASLRSFLKNSLPEYMIPSAFVSLPAMPLSRNGKIDRNVLQSMEVQNERSTAYVAPRDEVEAAVARIWEEVLGVPSVGVHDNFFELGGSSLLALETVTRIEERLGVELPAGAFESLITLADTAALVRETSHVEQGLEHLGLFAPKPANDAGELN